MIGAVARKKDPTAAPPYLSRFQLRAPPFAPHSGPGFFYADPGREQFLNMLLHLTQYSEELLLVTGPAGAGKTALLKKYLSRADEHWQICRVEGENATEPDRLFLRIAECFQFEAGKLPADRLLGALSSHLAQLHQQMTPVLVIDDAHRLSDDALEIALRLATLQGEHGRLIRVTLFAEASLLDRLADPRFESIPDPHRLDLRAFDEEHTGAYLNHRLRAAGYNGTTPFTTRYVKRIFKVSQGLPARINREAHQVLSELAREGGFRFERRHIKVALGAIGLLAATVLLRDPVAALLSRAGTAPSPAVTERSSKPASQPIVRDAEGFPGIGDGSQSQVTLARGDTLLVSCGAPPRNGEPAREQPPKRQNKTDVSKPAPVSGRSATPTYEPGPGVGPEPRLIATDSNPITGSAIPQSVVVRGENLVPIGNVAVSSREGARVLQPEQIEAIDAETLRLTLNTGTDPDVWAIQVTRKDGKRSNVARFEVVAPGREEPPPTEALPAIANAESVEEPSQGPKTPGRSETSSDEVPAQAPPPPASSEPGTGAVPVATGKTSAPLQSDTLRETGSPDAQSATPVPVEPIHEQPKEPEVEPAVRPQGGKQLSGAPPGLLGADWILALPRSHFTVQLAAANQRKSIVDFVRDHNLEGPLAIYQRRGGESLQILVQGDYLNPNAAEKAVGELPAAVRRAKPWVRSLGSIVPEISAARTVPPDRGAAWLWGRNPRNWTIQLSAAATPEAVRDVVAGRDLAPLAVAAVHRQGKLWYELLYGDFANRQDALTAIGRLPASLKASAPWPRRFGDVQVALTEANG